MVTTPDARGMVSSTKNGSDQSSISSSSVETAPFRTLSGVACSGQSGARLGRGSFGSVYSPQLLRCLRHLRGTKVSMCSGIPASAVTRAIMFGLDEDAAGPPGQCQALPQDCAQDAVVKAFTKRRELVYELRNVMVLYRIFKDPADLARYTALLPQHCWPVLRARGLRAGTGSGGIHSGSSSSDEEDLALLYRLYDMDLERFIHRWVLRASAADTSDVMRNRRAFRAALYKVMTTFLRFCGAVHAAGYAHMDAKVENVLLTASRPEDGGASDNLGVIKHAAVSDYGMLSPFNDIHSDGSPPFLSPLLSMAAHERPKLTQVQAEQGDLERRRRVLWQHVDPELKAYRAYSVFTARRGGRGARSYDKPGVVDFHAMGASLVYTARHLPIPTGNTSHVQSYFDDLVHVAKILMLPSRGAAAVLDGGRLDDDADIKLQVLQHHMAGWTLPP